MKKTADQKIVSLLEKLSQVLRVLLWNTAKETGLSPIQTQFLLYLNSHPPLQCKTSNLAREFNLTQATVSDALGSLAEKKLIYKEESKKDRRTSSLILTTAGKWMAKKLVHWPDAIKKSLGCLSEGGKSQAMTFMMDIIKHMQSGGVIQSARMCLLCNHFLKDARPAAKKPHYCKLTKTPLGITDLNIDCAMHDGTTKEIL
ncbi:MAG: hypothetical protein A3I09_02630 [Deltaproteobacteria bacterium RIFCSPLOWO2_02_FULL_47_10]|nr:MAG: hypothetical protein A3I09_02630 [Deltaproteobacteria bacterium RIFCSPLOWO2_02_FULL_47_10]